MVLDSGSKRIIDGVVREDDILKENVTSRSNTEEKSTGKQDTEHKPDIEQIEARRPMNKEMDAVYLLSPQPHIVDCLLADLERRRYRKSYIIWTSCEDPHKLILFNLDPLETLTF